MVSAMHGDGGSSFEELEVHEVHVPTVHQHAVEAVTMDGFRLVETRDGADPTAACASARST